MKFLSKHCKVRNALALILLCILIIPSYGCTMLKSPDAKSAESSGEIKKEAALSSWNDTEMKRKIIDFVASVTDKTKKTFVPEESRIATLDMDGTIICEKPLWLEMNVAQNYLYEQAVKHPELLSQQIYQEAYRYHTDPNNPANMEALENDAVNIMTQAFYPNFSEEDYIGYVKGYIQKNQNTDYGIKLKQTFFKPMLDLIELLQKNKFKVYIVSGSEEGLIWGTCEDTVALTREHEIGTLIQLAPRFTTASGISAQFIRGNMYLEPRNLKDGKAENIYYRTGKHPIFAFGNTADDYQMLTYASTNKYTNMACLLVHDDIKREYDYPDKADKASIEKTAKDNKWNLVSIKDNFKVVFNN